MLISVGFLSLPFWGDAQSRPLEIKYPEIFGVKLGTVDVGLPTYAKYIFNFVIVISGLIAFAALIWAGIVYSTSYGKPERMKEAKSRIKSALLGLLILLFSFLILTTLNPELVIFRLPNITTVPVTPPPTIPPASSELYENPYDKIRIVLNSLSNAVAGIDSQTNTLNSQVSQCDCSNAIAACICGSRSSSGGGGMGGGGIGGGGGGIGGGGGGGF